MKYWDKLSGTSFRQHVIDAMTGEEELVMIPEPETHKKPTTVLVECSPEEYEEIKRMKYVE